MPPVHAASAGNQTRQRAGPHALAGPVGAASVLSPAVLEAIIRALSRAVELGAAPALNADGKPLLDLEETAQLLGVSRMTVARLAEEGHLPSVVIRRGRVQKTRRIPRAFVERMVADACAGVEVDMEQYTAAWLAEQAAQITDQNRPLQ